MLVVIKGAGDIASGIAVRLHNCGFELVMTDLAEPTAIRRTVCFSEAIRCGSQEIEGVYATQAKDVQEALQMVREGKIAVIADKDADCISELHPDVVVDAILAKRNIGTHIDLAPIVIGVGPGFCAGMDCHAVVETQRGHNLGRVIHQGTAAPNTGIPGNIGGYTVERVLRTPCAGYFESKHEIGDSVKAGDVAAVVNGKPICSKIDGIIRGLLPNGTKVFADEKCGDVDPRGVLNNCYTVSDKARAVGGGVLEAILGGYHERH